MSDTPTPDPTTPHPTTTDPAIHSAPKAHHRLTHLKTKLAAHVSVPRRDRGMSTAEYAVGTIAACAFAALLFKVVSSPEVQQMLSSLIDRALNTTG
ncbi:DUF4244 domain-containing protein [Nonomuraea sp. NPDC050310]|uniref:DUF4244 domain-containing protein n=1 Tax=Nonomuraea sp. NPDC050310 TaxID=3154935 RepID=UPI0033CF3120